MEHCLYAGQNQAAPLYEILDDTVNSPVIYLGSTLTTEWTHRTPLTSVTPISRSPDQMYLTQYFAIVD